MTGISKEKKWIKLSLFLSSSVMLAFTLYCIFKYGNYFLLGNLQKMNNDDVKYVRSAIVFAGKGILTYHDPSMPTIYIMPGLTIILSFFVKLFGVLGSITAFRIFQAVLQAICLFIIFIIAKQVFNRSVGITACIMDTLYAAEIYSACTILTETLFKFLLLLLIYLTLKALKTNDMRYYILGGAVWGLDCLMRPTIALYPAVVLLMWLMYKHSFKQILKYSAITLLVFCAVMSPWWIRNYLAFQRFIPLTLSTGNPFLQGTYFNYDQTDRTPYLREPNNDIIRTNEIEMETGMYRLKQKFRSEPLKYLYWYTLGKTFHMWSFPFYWKVIPGIPFGMAGVYHYLVLIFGIAGMVLYLRKTNSRAVLLGLVILYFNTIHLPYFTSSRYAYPVMPLVIIFAASAMVKVVGKKKLPKNSP